jgi:hypothetical protein
MFDFNVFSHHRVAAIILAGLCAWVSLSLIARMWFVHRRAGLIKKLFWSLVLLVPIAGWIFYGALFHPPSVTGIRAPEDQSGENTPFGTLLPPVR